MRRFLVFLTAPISVMMACAQSADSVYVAPTNCFAPTSALRETCSNLRPTCNSPVIRYHIEDDGAEKSVVTNETKARNLPLTFATPQVQTMNWWQALGTIGIGLTRGLVFDDYTSSHTLDD